MISFSKYLKAPKPYPGSGIRWLRPLGNSRFHLLHQLDKAIVTGLLFR
jgi:hypothetical protein